MEYFSRTSKVYDLRNFLQTLVCCVFFRYILTYTIVCKQQNCVWVCVMFKFLCRPKWPSVRVYEYQNKCSSVWIWVYKYKYLWVRVKYEFVDAHVRLFSGCVGVYVRVSVCVCVCVCVYVCVCVCVCVCDAYESMCSE